MGNVGRVTFEERLSTRRCGNSTIGKPVRVRDGATFRTGILAGFGPDGELLLRDEQGTCSAVWAGDLAVA